MVDESVDLLAASWDGIQVYVKAGARADSLADALVASMVDLLAGVWGDERGAWKVDAWVDELGDL